MSSDIFPIFAGKIFRDVISRGDRNGVYLTFDDGPDPDSTPEIMRILNQKICPATFFVTGTQAEKHPSIIERIYEAGHSIGGHGYHHNSLVFQTTKHINVDINRCNEVISGITGEVPSLFRPPYGRFGLSLLNIARKQNKKMTLWSLSGMDWKSPEAEEIVNRITLRVKSGDIILLHDRGIGTKATIKALPRIIDGIRLRGYDLKKLGDNC